MVYSLSVIYQPQFVANAATKLSFFPSVAAANPLIVPAGFFFQISVMRVANVSTAPVGLTVWRVPSGSANANANVVVPQTVNVPIASNTFPQFDVTALWGAVLQPGDSIYALASAASALVVQADGAILQN